MPKIYSVQAVKEVVEMEGLAYTIQGYLSVEYIEDEKLQVLFLAARQTLSNIEKYLEEVTGEEMDYG